MPDKVTIDITKIAETVRAMVEEFKHLPFETMLSSDLTEKDRVIVVKWLREYCRKHSLDVDINKHVIAQGPIILFCEYISLNHIQAIRELRSVTHGGLVETKKLIDSSSFALEFDSIPKLIRALHTLKNSFKCEIVV